MFKNKGSFHIKHSLFYIFNPYIKFLNNLRFKWYFYSLLEEPDKKRTVLRVLNIIKTFFTWIYNFSFFPWIRIRTHEKSPIKIWSKGACSETLVTHRLLAFRFAPAPTTIKNLTLTRQLPLTWTRHVGKYENIPCSSLQFPTSESRTPEVHSLKNPAPSAPIHKSISKFGLAITS